jgi:hypothetical protein
MNTLRKIPSMIGQAIQYVVDAAGRIFTSSKDEYPESGVQPFEGDIPKSHH